MDLRRIEVFVAAANAQSFTTAARRLHLSQSAVSQQVKQLEDEVGEALFIRTRQMAKLTPRGERLLPAAIEMLQRWGQFTEKAITSRNVLSGPLTVGTSAGATTYLWAAIYREFALTHPGVFMDVRTMAATRASIEGVQSGELDLAFVPLPLNLPSVEEVVLGVQRAVLCAAPSHPLAKIKVIHRDDLVGQRFVLYESSMSFRWLTDVWFKKLDVTPTIGVESNDTYLLKAMIEAGYGIGFLPDWGIQRELDERRLVALAIQERPPQQSLGLLYPAEGLSRTGREFASFCRAHSNLLPRVARSL